MLSASSLRRVAGDSTVLLDNVSLAISPGDRIALAGPSGSGKTLLLRALALLDPIDGGRVEWLGTTPAGDAVPRFRRQAVYLAQSPMIDEGRVAEQLERPWRFASAEGRGFDAERATRLLARAGRDAQFLTQAGDNLSGGEAQLVALVRALLLEPRLLLLDEPTAAMDEETKQSAETLLEAWIDADPGRSWLWVSHDPLQLARTCRRELRIAAGRLSA